MSLLIQRQIVGPLQANCYLISCEITGFTFIIDPGESPGKIISCIQRNEIIPKGIILTHGHMDHIGGLKILCNEFRIPVMIHKDDVFMLSLIGIAKPEKYLNHEEILELGREKILVIHTPGHSPGSVCVKSGNQVFTGDTLFRDGIGRTDLPGGSKKQIEESIKERLFILPNETIVYPGHGPQTTIGLEKNV